jgi:hypothetical protein
MQALERYKPRFATVIDWERDDQLSEVLSWAEQASQYVTEALILIPKVHSGIPRLPRRIGGLPVRLGYSVPTSYGGTELQVCEFAGWDVHLLGGAPHEQMILSQYMRVVTVDTNYHMKLANRFCQFWQPGTAKYASNHHWPTLLESDGSLWGDGTSKADAHLEAFRRSCIAIAQAWKGERVQLWGLDKPRYRTSQRSKTPLASSQMSLDL